MRDRCYGMRDSPLRRLREGGPSALSDTEMLAILLGGDPGASLSRAGELLARFGGLNGLARAGEEELVRFPGIGPRRASMLRAALELGRRAGLACKPPSGVIRRPEDAAYFFKEMAFLEAEQLRVLLLDIRHRPLRQVMVCQGSVIGTVVRPADVFREAVRENAPRMILAHNHPSGDPEPSEADLQLTRQMIEVGDLLGIEVLDHLIIGREGFTSLRAGTRGTWDLPPEEEK